MASILWLIVGAYCSVVVHELGHVLAAKAFRISPINVYLGVGPELYQLRYTDGCIWTLRLLPIGGRCEMILREFEGARNRGFGDVSWWQRSVIYAAGPVSNVTFGICFLYVNALIWAAFPNNNIEVFEQPAYFVGYYSVCVGLFNLLPVHPLDGGQIILTFFEHLFCPVTDKRKTQLAFAGNAMLILSSIGAGAYLVAYNLMST